MFTWTPGSCCLQCTCCFGKTGWHFQTEDENFLHLKFTAFAEVHLKCSSMLPAVMYTPPEYMAFSHSQHAETPQQSKNKIKKLFLSGHGQEHLEVCFRSGQYSWSTHRPGSGWSLAAPRPWSPTAAKAHSGAVPESVQGAKMASSSSKVYRCHCEDGTSWSKPVPGVVPLCKSLTGCFIHLAAVGLAKRVQTAHIWTCLHFPGHCYRDTKPSLQTSNDCLLPVIPRDLGLQQQVTWLQLRMHFFKRPF